MGRTSLTNLAKVIDAAGTWSPFLSDTLSLIGCAFLGITILKMLPVVGVSGEDRYTKADGGI